MTAKEEFEKNYPFMSCISSNGVEYIGIIINMDNDVTSIYDWSAVKNHNNADKFLELGETWWWESNRKIPINIFLKPEMNDFRVYIKTFNSKDVSLVFGPSVNLKELAERRIKRRSIQLVRATRKK